MRLIDNSTDTQLNIGDWITDDNGTEWYVAGYGIEGYGAKFVQLIEMSKLNEIIHKAHAGHYDLRIEMGGEA